MNQLTRVILILVLAQLAIPVVFAADIEVGEACGLADAIEAANRDTSVGACPPGAGDDAIRLTGDVTLDEALPAIATSLSIDGGGYTLDANGNRAFLVRGAGDLHITALTLTGGRADVDSAACIEPSAETDMDETDESDAPEPAGFGGAICIDGGAVGINASQFRDNSAERSGGAIANFGGALEIADSEFSGNSAREHGGALYNEGGFVDLSGSAFSDNQAVEYGGAIDNISGARLVIAGGGFTGNLATTGGAIGNWRSSLFIAGSRFDANEAENGGAIQSEDGQPAICYSQFRGNVAGNFGAAIYSVRGELTAASNDLRGNSASEGGVIHIVEPEAAILGLRENNFADNAGEDCLDCGAVEEQAADCSADLD